MSPSLTCTLTSLLVMKMTILSPLHACYLSSPAIYHHLSQEQRQLSLLRLQASAAALPATAPPLCAARMPHTCRAAAVQCVFVRMLCTGEYQSHLLACWPKLR